MFTPDLLSGKRILVTGGGSGLGLAMSRAFVAHGAEVAIVGRSEERLREGACLVNRLVRDSACNRPAGRRVRRASLCGGLLF